MGFSTRIFAILIALFSVQIHAQAKPDCSMRELDELKTVINCRASGNIYGCTPLNPLTKAKDLKSSKPVALKDRFKVNLVDIDLKKHKELYENATPQKIKAMQSFIAAGLTDDMLKDLAAGKKSPKVDELADKLGDSDKKTFFKAVLEDFVQPLAKEIARTNYHEINARAMAPLIEKSLAHATLHAGERITLPFVTAIDQDILASEFADALLALGIKVPATVVATGVGAVAGIVLNPVVVACSEAFANYIGRDPEEGCKYKYDINPQVMNFLSLPRADQEKMLKDPQMCFYYDKLYQEQISKKTPRITRLQCGRNRALIQVERPGVDHPEVVDVTASQGFPQGTPLMGRIRQIASSSNQNLFVQPNGSIQYFSASSVRDVSDKYNLAIGDALNCCDASDEAKHQSCMNIFNSSTGPTSAEWDVRTSGDSSAQH